MSNYLAFGVEHILTGYGHRMFVVGSFLLIRGKRWLVAVLACTDGHSRAQSGVALGVSPPPGALAEIFIAFSVVFLAVDALRSHRGTLQIRLARALLIPFGFGFGLLQG